MRIDLDIKESSEVALTNVDDYEAIQGECCITVLNLNFPATIKNYPINNYTKYIEFAECVEVGPCVKFLDEIEGDTYELKEPATNFRKIKVQLTLRNTIDKPGHTVTWRSKIFELEFGEAINAEGTSEVQNQLLSLKQIEDEWEDYIKNNTFRVVSKLSGVPTADATNVNQVIFYLGENTDSFTYGHYYRCTYASNIYSWKDLTQDPGLLGTADSIREINKSRSMQLWLGTTDELAAETTQNGVIYAPEDLEITEVFDEVLTEMKKNEEYKTNHPFLNLEENESGVLQNGDYIIPRLKRLWSSDSGIWLTGTEQSFNLGVPVSGKNLKIVIYKGNNNKLGEYNINCGLSEFSVAALSTTLYPDGSAVISKIGKTVFNSNGNDLLIKQLFYSIPDLVEDTYGYQEKVTAIYEIIE